MQCVPRHDFGADEAALNVGVDRAGRLLRARVARNRPRAAFIFTDREERHVAQQVVGGANHAIEPGLRQAQIGHERGRVGGLQLGDLQLDPGADAHRGRGGLAREGLESRVRGRGIGEPEIRFVEVDDQQQRLGGEELKAPQPARVIR